jgi:peptidoglycan hydrolase-like protein with peptidoglycan-binding domain
MAAKVSRLPEICTTFGTRLQNDLGITVNKAAGVFGNGDIESQGYNTLQEIAPVVEGSAGGFGWMQWTGPRRRKYLAWAAAQNLNPSDDETNYRFMVFELKNDEKAALRALMTCADDPSVAATIVCTKYLRPGIPHLDKRIASAKRAVAYLAPVKGAPATGPIPVLPPVFQQAAPVAPAAPQEPVNQAAPAVQVEAGRWPEDSLSAFEIKAIQQRLLDLGYHVVGFADGKWGKRTSAALTALQQQAVNDGAQVAIDGHYGPQTRALLSSDAMKATVSPERASVTSKVLAKLGNPTVLASRKITWASGLSALAGVGALAGALSSGWTTELPFPFSLVANFLPPWALPLMIVAFNLYSAAKSTGLIGSAVARVQQGIDNTGAPAAPGGTAPISLPFGLDKLFQRS